MSTEAAAATDDAFKVHFAANLSRLREAKGLNRAQFARLVGVDKMRITRLESGEHAPGGALLLKIAAALDTTAEALAEPPPDATPASADEAQTKPAAAPRAKRRR